jgi:NADPH-dependent 2,4-dienoyl-CoA reductase/sulfur reductase-like enzyme
MNTFFRVQRPDMREGAGGSGTSRDPAVDRSRSGQMPRVVIVGGGFGGVAAARALRHCDAEVILIDRRNHHAFQPLLYQVATAFSRRPRSPRRFGNSLRSKRISV